MTKFIKTYYNQTIAYNKIEGKKTGIIFLGGFNSDMQGQKALEIEDWAKKDGVLETDIRDSILERTGILFTISENEKIKNISSNTLAFLNRQNFSFPPDHGGKLVTLILKVKRDSPLIPILVLSLKK